jgi:hypothetical protein
MTVIELPEEQAEALKAQAQARGLTVGEWIAQLTGHIAPKLEAPVDDDRPIWEVLADSLEDIPAEDRALLPRVENLPH